MCVCRVTDIESIEVKLLTTKQELVTIRLFHVSKASFFYRSFIKNLIYGLWTRGQYSTVHSRWSVLEHFWNIWNVCWVSSLRLCTTCQNTKPPWQSKCVTLIIFIKCTSLLGIPGSWHSSGCQLTQTNCTNTFADQIYSWHCTGTPWMRWSEQCHTIHNCWCPPGLNMPLIRIWLSYMWTCWPIDFIKQCSWHN